VIWTVVRGSEQKGNGSRPQMWANVKPYVSIKEARQVLSIGLPPRGKDSSWKKVESGSLKLINDREGVKNLCNYVKTVGSVKEEVNPPSAIGGEKKEDK